MTGLLGSRLSKGASRAGVSAQDAVGARDQDLARNMPTSPDPQ